MKHRLPLCLAVIVGASALGAEPVPDDTPQPVNAIAASAPSITDEIQFFGSTSVPEPSTFVLAVTGGIGAFAYGWRRKRLSKNK